MSISVQDVSRLREMTGVGIGMAKKALEETKGDFDKAVAHIRKSGQKVAESKLARTMREGAIGHYIHPNGKIAALVVVTCESDFVGRSDPFKELVHDLALHVAAAHPRYLKPEEVPAEVIAHEREIYTSQVADAKKPAAVLKKIVDGKLDKFYEETCLLRQKFVKDDAVTVGELVTQVIQKLGENIQVREFVRMSLLA